MSKENCCGKLFAGDDYNHFFLENEQNNNVDIWFDKCTFLGGVDKVEIFAKILSTYQSVQFIRCTFDNGFLKELAKYFGNIIKLKNLLISDIIEIDNYIKNSNYSENTNAHCNIIQKVTPKNFGENVIDVLCSDYFSHVIIYKDFSKDELPLLQNVIHNNTKLESFQIFSCNGFNDTCFEIFANIFEKNNSLKELSLCGSIPIGLTIPIIRINGGKHHNNFLQLLAKNKTIKKLKLQFCNITDNDINLLDSNSTIEEFDLSYNGISANGFLVLIKNSNIKSLVINNNIFSADSVNDHMVQILETLTNNTSLHTLNVTCCNLRLHVEKIIDILSENYTLRFFGFDRIRLNRIEPYYEKIEELLKRNDKIYQNLLFKKTKAII